MVILISIEESFRPALKVQIHPFTLGPQPSFIYEFPLQVRHFDVYGTIYLLLGVFNTLSFLNILGVPESSSFTPL